VLYDNNGWNRDVEFVEDVVDVSRHNTLQSSSKVAVETTDAGSLRISISRLGIQGSNLVDVVFTVSWLGLIGYLTLSGPGVIVRLFTIPFWLAGAQMANKSVIDPVTAVQLTIGVFGWSLDKTLLGSKTRETQGPTWQLEEAQIICDMEINGKPCTCIQFQSGLHLHRFGHALTTREKEWIVTEINEWLQENHEDIKKAARIIREGGQEVGI
jgi:eukaryotic-like serine/threonine-protein kinase